MLAVVAAGAVAFAGSNSAQAAIVLTISDGIAIDTLTFSTNANSLSQTYTIDGYTGNIDVVSTNFPGNAAQGTLTTTTTIQNATGASPLPLTITAGVYTDTTGTTLANFTAPTSSILNLKNDVTANGSALGGAAQISGTSTANGTTSPVATVLINTQTESVNNTPFLGQPVTGQYTLMNQAVISGIVTNDSGLSLAVASTVTAVAPEPSTLATALVALPFIGVLALRRKRSNPA